MGRVSVLVGRGAVGIATLGAVAALVVAAIWDHDAFAVAVAVEAALVVPLAVAGAYAVRAAPRNVVGWLLLASGMFMPLATASFLYAQAAFDHGHALPGAHLAGWLDGWPWVPAQLSVALFGSLLFPDGRLPSRRWRVAIVIDLLVVGTLLVSLLFDPGLLDWPREPNPTGIPGGFGAMAHGLFVFIILVAPMTVASAIGFELRGRKVTNPAVRAARRLVRPAVWLLVASWLICDAAGIAGASTTYSLPFESLGMAAAGVTCLVAIRRYGLFDAQLIIRRGLVYGTLSAIILLIYGLVALVFSLVGAPHATAPVAVVAAILVAVPLRDLLQRAANRFVYGLRDDPVATLLSLGRQLERAAAADEVLPAAAKSLQQTLRLRHVAIHTADDALAAATGVASNGPPIEVPLLYAGELVGTLVATQSEGDSPLDNDRRALLASIAHPIAAALRTTALSRDLAASHERLVNATEEERRRLRRDLHDGLGPALSSAVLGVARAGALVVARPEVAAQQLETLTAQLQEAVADVRRLVYDLRPPALDHLGLLGALDEQARTLGHFTVNGPSTTPPISAATEVTAYRIAMEAMNNSLRHARASAGTVSISVDDRLHLEVRDDGVGLPDGYRAGVGITSMRERAAALGGRCVIEADPGGGTVVRAWLPV